MESGSISMNYKTMRVKCLEEEEEKRIYSAKEQKKNNFASRSKISCNFKDFMNNYYSCIFL